MEVLNHYVVHLKLILHCFVNELAFKEKLKKEKNSSTCRHCIKEGRKGIL